VSNHKANLFGDGHQAYPFGGRCEESIVLVLGSGGYIFAELQKAIHVPFDRQRDDQLFHILFRHMEFI
jgi:hypothetical protein